MYEYWCELGIVTLHICSEFLLENGMLKYKRKLENKDQEVINVFLYDYTGEKQFPYDFCTYREKVMSQKGFYIGHHFGEKAFLRVINNEIHLCSNNYNRNLLRVDRLLNALKIRLFKVVKCDKKQENVGNSYFIPALFIYHTPTLCIHIN